MRINCSQQLDAPVMRLASWDTPVTFAIPLEQGFLAKHTARIGASGPDW